MYKPIWLVVLIMVSSLAKAQTPSIRGTVQDSVAGTVLEEATVSLLALPGSLLVRRLRSGKDGFVFRQLKPGNYLVTGSYLGYLPDTALVTVHPGDSLAIPVKLIMQLSSKPLMEVVVHASIPPVIVRNDTIAFNAGAYPTRPNATVEDLLKKLPGIEIDKNGVVTMQGRKVDKIYLDGKEFFLGDIKTATQNLPADVVGQIEAFDTQSEQGKLTGIKDNSGGKTLNIKLKKDRKAGYFGKAYAGGGNDNSYSAGGTATSLSGSRWLFGTANANNINNQFTGTENQYGSGGGGVQTFKNFDFNYRESLGKNVIATLNGGVYSSKTTLLQSTSRNTFLTDSSLLENRSSRSVSQNTNYHLDAIAEYNIDSLNTLIYRGNWAPQKSNNQSQDTVAIMAVKPSGSYLSNKGLTDNSSSTSGAGFTNNLDFRSRFRKTGRTLYIGLSQADQHQDQPAGLYSLVNNFDSLGTPGQRIFFNQRSGQSTSGNSYGGAVAYTEPLSPNHILDISYRLNTSVNRSDKESFDYDSATGKYDMPDTSTSNRFFNRNTVQRVSAGYNVTNGKFRYQLGLATQFTYLANDNYTLKSQIIQHFNNWFPRASLIYSVSGGKNLSLNYSGNSTQPTIDQLQPLPDLTNPFLVKLGNPDLQQQFDHNLNAAFSSFDVHSFQNWQLSLQGSYSEHKITNSTTILSGGIQQIQYVNVEGVYHLSSNITYGFPIGNKKGNANISARGQYGHDISILNGVQYITTAISAGGSLNINYHPAEKAFVDLNASLDYSGAGYSINTTQSTRTWLQNYNLNFSYELPLSLTVGSNYGLQINGSQGSMPARATSLWNAFVYKPVFHNQAGQVRFSAFDLLNAANTYTQNVGINYVETRRANLPGRIFLLSFVYNFRQFAAGKSARSGRPVMDMDVMQAEMGY